MLLGLVNDFSSDVALDAQLLAVSDSGLYLNSGIHPSITVDNLLHFLPNITITPVAYAAGTTYAKYEDSRLMSDIVTDGGIIYQSLTTANTGNTPSSSASDWLVTTLESLRLKVFINSVLDRVKADVNLIRRQTDNQYLYNLVEQNSNLAATLLPNDYAGYMFEAKGSDYTSFTINEMALQATTASSQSLYVINQGNLITTLTLNPNIDGRLVFEDIDYNFSGKGQWFFVIDSQNVLLDGGQLDPLKYDGFVARTVNGTGANAQDSIYTYGTSGNGLSFNITSHFDPSVYVTKNLKNFGKYIRSCFELQALTMFRANSGNRSNLQERTQMTEESLRIEVMSLEHNTAASRYESAKVEAIKMLSKTNDREIDRNDDNLMTITLAGH